MDLRLTESEFWELTLREFTALSDRNRQAIQREDLRFGYLLSMTANANRDPKKQSKAVQPWDFFPSLKEFDNSNQVEAGKFLNWALTHNKRLEAEQPE